MEQVSEKDTGAMAHLNFRQPLQVFLWGFAVVCILITSLRVYQVDLWWQLSEGLSILHTGHLPLHPPAAFGLLRVPYFDEYGAYEVLIALLYRVSGFAGLWLFFGTTYLTLFVLPIAFTSKKFLNFSVFSTLLLFFATILLANRLEERPELVGSLFLVLLFLLFRHTTLVTFGSKHLALVALLFCLWSNTHSSFIVGLAAVVLWLMSEIASLTLAGTSRWVFPRAIVFLGVALLGATLNPYGLARFLFPFQQQTDVGSMVLSAEMWPVTRQSETVGILLALIGIFLLGVAISPKRPPVWLACFAFVTWIMTLFNFRYTNLLAVSLIFIYAERQTEHRQSPAPFFIPYWIDISCLIALCVTAFYLDVAWALLIGRAQIQEPVGRTERPFAPELVDSLAQTAPAGTAILCHFGEGAYLTFAGHGRLRPLVDTGLIRFSNETKRTYYFLEHEPSALDFALGHLAVQDILVTRPVSWWTLVLRERTDWRFVRCTSDGLIFQHQVTHATAFTPVEIDQIRQARETLLRRNDRVSAFCYSTLIASPEESWALLEPSDRRGWSQPFSDALSLWLKTLPAQKMPRKIVLPISSTIHPPPWQDWNNGGVQLMQRMSVLLNENLQRPY